MQNIRIMNKLKSIVSLIVVLAMFVIMSKDNVAYAASASVAISSATVTQGQEVKVTVTISADANIGAYNFYLEYDANILEAVSGFEGGGGGRIQLIYDVPDEASLSKQLTKTITFKAKAPGTTEVKYVCINGDDGVIDYDTIENMAITSSNGSVTVNAPVIASKNNNLQSMSVAAVRADGSSYDVPLSPGFSKDVTKYNIQVEEGVTKLVVAAKTEDAKATIYVQWANLDPGENTTKVIVTAEDGSKKEYVIYTKVPVPETTTPEPVEPIVTVVDGVEYFIENIDDATVLPEGFEAVEYDYNGEKIVVGKGLVKNIIVMYLTTGNGEAGKLFIYDEVAKSFYPMVNVAMSQKLYTIVKAPAELVIPEGFTESVITIDGVELSGWVTEEIEGIYLVYAMNWDGKAGLYYYDTSESQMIKYFDSSVEVGVGLDEYNNIVSENESLKGEITKLQNQDNETDDAKMKMYEYIIYITLAVIVILIGVILILIVKKKKDDAEEEEDRDEAMDSAFANIISKEEAESEAKETAEEDIDEEEYDDDEYEEDDEDYDEEAELASYSDEDEVESENEEVEVDSELKSESESVLPEVDEVATVAAVVVEEPVELEAVEAENTESEVAESEEVETEEAVAEEAETEEAETEEAESTVVRPEAAEIEATEEAEFDDISKALENELQSAVADIFSEEEAETIETVEEKTETITNIEETIETAREENKLENVETVQTTEEVLNKKPEKTENKKRVEKILQDENTSIKDDELDMVIDELFDDLFGE